jgi:hypothetical protein
VRITEQDEDYPTLSPPRNRSNTSAAAIVLGGFSVVIGALSLTFALGLSMCCFILTWGTVPPSALGLTLGIIGLAVPLATKKRGIALPIAGVSVNVLALVVFVLAQMLGIAWFSRQAPVAPQSAPIATQTKKTIPPPVDTVTDGDVKVTITGAERVAGQRLVIHLKVQNTSKQRKITVKTWGVGKDDGKIKLVDQFDNDYPLQAAGAEPNQHAETVLNANAALDETLNFDEPPDDFDTLILELPAKNYGGAGRIRFVIPNDKVTK